MVQHGLLFCIDSNKKGLKLHAIKPFVITPVRMRNYVSKCFVRTHFCKHIVGQMFVLCVKLHLNTSAVCAADAME